jgi:hypothetical protein
MLCHTKKPCNFLIAAAAVAIVFASITPASMLTNKSANADPLYSSGWKDGCESGVNASSPIRAMVLGAPFIKQNIDAKTNYKDGWNEGYATCRIDKEAMDKWIQTLLIIAALLFASGFCCKSA